MPALDARLLDSRPKIGNDVLAIVDDRHERRLVGHAVSNDFTCRTTRLHRIDAPALWPATTAGARSSACGNAAASSACSLSARRRPRSWTWAPGEATSVAGHHRAGKGEPANDGCPLLGPASGSADEQNRWSGTVYRPSLSSSLPRLAFRGIRLA